MTASDEEYSIRRAYDLSGRTAIVTGAAGGIGQASAFLLAQAGADVVCSDVSSSVAGTAEEIARRGGSARTVVADVGNRDQVERLVADATAWKGRLNVLCHCAAVIVSAETLQTEDSELDRLIDINLKGTFYTCRAAARIMVGQGAGSIVTLSSGAIDNPVSTNVSYGMTKAAVTQFTRNLANEVGPSGVRVNTVAPGYIETPMTGRHYTDGAGNVDTAARTALHSQIRGSQALKLIGQASDVAHAVLFLAADASRFWTGQILRPNGGMAMPW